LGVGTQPFCQSHKSSVHGLPSTQAGLPVVAQAVSLHASPVVQALPSLHAAPSLGGWMQPI
jgi:hypothetical protein